jgi:hypothetical protein
MKRATMALAVASMLAGGLVLASNDLAKDVKGRSSRTTHAQG